MLKILKTIKNVFIHIRSSLKFTFLLIVATVLIIGIISVVYKPMYSVTLKGEFIGYTTNKTQLQKRINEYIENTYGNVAFIDVENLPEYSLCLMKKENQTNDDEIFERVKNSGTTYYEYYAILEDSQEKYYVSTKEEAEDVINKLKEKKSKNINNLGYTRLHSTELKEFQDTETIVTALYQKPKVVVASKSSAYSKYSGQRIISNATPSAQVLGIGLIKPISGIITSRFGVRSGGTHKGLDIATSAGTTVAAAAGGTVVFSGWDSYGLGNCIRISHGNGVTTVYGHCSKLYVTAGQTVAQGEAIAAVGSTGNSTGPHLHLEIRVNDVPQNPQLYLYK